jgi:hypothetical protein
LFGYWAEIGQKNSESMLGRIASQKQEAFMARHEVSKQEEIERSRRWLRVKANQLCGAFVPETADLFGDFHDGPAWSRQDDPLARLVSFATDPETPKPKRRDANVALEIVGSIEHSYARPDSIVCRPVGMLMLVPRDAL